MIGEDIKITMNLDSNLGNIKVDPSQIEQVIMNLAVNARDAMPQGGELTIETPMLTLVKIVRTNILKSFPDTMLWFQ